MVKNKKINEKNSEKTNFNYDEEEQELINNLGNISREYQKTYQDKKNLFPKKINKKESNE